MSQTLGQAVRVPNPRNIIPVLITRFRKISEDRPDRLRFRLVVMRCIITKLIAMRSNVSVSWEPERFEMEDSPEAAGFYEEIKKEFEDNPMLKDRRERILTALLHAIQAETP